MNVGHINIVINYLIHTEILQTKGICVTGMEWYYTWY